MQKHHIRRVCVVLNEVLAFARDVRCFVFCVYVVGFCVWSFNKQGPSFRNCVFAIVKNCNYFKDELQVFSFNLHRLPSQDTLVGK